MKHLIFLSHIHEERELAILLQQAIEDEFSGFVEVFVSSDGSTIPTGVQFLNRIEDGLVKCVGAIYLISPVSVKRNWINFELGAVWIRNHISKMHSGPDIPAIPLLHSGISFSDLPTPINSLNAISVSNSASLKLAFSSLQTAVGVSGAKLKTDFDKLAEAVVNIERKYTLDKKVDELIDLITDGIPDNRAKLKMQVDSMPLESTIDIIFNGLAQEKLDKILTLESNSLKGYFKTEVLSSTLAFTDKGNKNVVDAKFSIPIKLIKSKI